VADKILTCKDCNAEFVFSEGEQAFYLEKGFQNEPQRCPPADRQENSKEGTTVLADQTEDLEETSAIDGKILLLMKN